jgi:hypothetical protein
MKDFKELLELVLGQRINAITYEDTGLHLLMLGTSSDDVQKMKEHLASVVDKCQINVIKRVVNNEYNIEIKKERKKNRKREYKEYTPIENEVWKNIDNADGFMVSNLGRILEGDKILLPVINKGGYCLVSIKKNKKRKYYKLHRLVAEAFIPNPNNKPEVDHINTDKTDNRVENLRWVTHFENMFENEITFNRIKDNPTLLKKHLIQSIKELHE